MKLDVCICTHSPRRPVFRRVLQSLASQTLPRDQFHVWIIDNKSQPPLDEGDLLPLKKAGVSYTLLTEPRLGNVFAREKAIASTTGEWIVFVDDDNELADDYLQTVVEIAKANPHLGCFGGKLLLAPDLAVSDWMLPLLPYLAIKDLGDEVISNCASEWGRWEPPTAGAAVRRPVLNLYLDNLKRFKESARLGRKGKKGLLSAEDSLMMRGAFSLNLHCAYQPRLKLWHHIDPNRLNFRYFLRLLYNYGRSYVILERSLGKQVEPANKKYLARLLTNFPKSREKACKLAWEWGYFVESRANRTVPSPVKIPAAPDPLPIVIQKNPELASSPAVDPAVKP